MINGMLDQSTHFLSEKGQSVKGAKKMALQAIEELGESGEHIFMNEFLKKNKIIICTSGDKKQFITTDNPFVRFNKNNNNAIAVPGTEMYYPLSSNMLLFMHGDGN